MFKRQFNIPIQLRHAAAFKHLFQLRFQNDKRSRSALTDTALLGKHIKCFCGMQCVKQVIRKHGIENFTVERNTERRKDMPF